MYCLNCGKQIEDGSLFCIFCGSKCSQEERTEQIVTSKNNQTPKKKKEKVKKEKVKKEKKSPLVKILLCILALIFVGVVSYVSITQTKISRQFARGEKYLEESDYERAIETYEEILSDDKDNTRASYCIAEAYYEYGQDVESEDTKEAISLYRKSMKYGNLIEAYIACIQLCLNEEDYELAQDILDEAVEKFEYDKLGEFDYEIFEHEMLTSMETTEEPPAAEAVEELPVIEDAKPVGEVVNINITRATFNLATPDPTQVQKVQDAINEYIKDKINVQITLTDIGSGEYTDKVNLALANNDINLLWTASWESYIGTNDLVAANAAYDISDLLPGTPLYDSMDDNQWEATKYNGKNYFIPVYKDNVEGYDIMFRQDLINRYGWNITKVKTLKDLEPMLADAKAAGLQYPFLTQSTALFAKFYIDDFDFFTANSKSNWVAVDKKTNKVVNVIQTPQYKEFCTLMADWAESGYISEDDMTGTTSYTATQTTDWAISWWTDIPVNDEADARYGQDVTMQAYTDRWAHSTSALGSCYCVIASSTPEQVQACIDFMGLLYTDTKLADIYTFGIEGEDFSYNANGLVEQYSERYNHSMWESASATTVTPLSVEPANRADLYNVFNAGAKTSPAAGFRFDTTLVEAEYTACQNVFDTYGYYFENGSFASSDVNVMLEMYQEALDQAGYQNVLAEFQAQYDAWK